MRDGISVKLLETKKTNTDELIRLMVGRKITNLYPEKLIDFQSSDICFSIKNLRTERLKDITFDVRRGEILGLFGLMGCGTTEIARAIFGADKHNVDKMILNNKSIVVNTPWAAKREGIAYIPADRKQEGLMLIHTVATNATITVFDKIKKNKLINTKKEKKLVENWVEKLAIKTPSINTIINNLSGGNQQKVVLAKWLSIEPQLLILNEPTRGIDVGAKTEIYKLINKLCEQGIGIIMISSDLPEVMGMADRVAVIHEGTVAGIMEKSYFTQDEILAKAIGV